MESIFTPLGKYEYAYVLIFPFSVQKRIIGSGQRLHRPNMLWQAYQKRCEILTCSLHSSPYVLSGPEGARFRTFEAILEARLILSLSDITTSATGLYNDSGVI